VTLAAWPERAAADCWMASLLEALAEPTTTPRPEDVAVWPSMAPASSAVALPLPAVAFPVRATAAPVPAMAAPELSATLPVWSTALPPTWAPMLDALAWPELAPLAPSTVPIEPVLLVLPFWPLEVTLPEVFAAWPWLVSELLSATVWLDAEVAPSLAPPVEARSVAALSKAALLDPTPSPATLPLWLEPLSTVDAVMV
jgi:hypothetical protein